jgi:hypothetical protein
MTASAGHRTWFALAAALASLLAAGALAGAAAAQVRTVDAGSFTIYRAGARIGRETFTIRRSVERSGDVFDANATVEFDAERLSPRLSTDTSFAPLAYQMEVQLNNQFEMRLTGVISRGRFSTRVRTPTGQAAKEYIVSEGALVIDDDVFHQYYFLAQRLTGAAGVLTLPVVIPRRNLQETMRVTVAGTERIIIGGTPVDARHLVAVGSGGATRNIWVDAQGRVLKVTLGNITALRDELPT